MNAVILTAILSAGNSGMYSSTRMLFDMAKEGRAPNGSQNSINVAYQ
jgi:lysine-specific permease